MKRILGLDVGGANLKMAHTDGTARTVPFELWKQPQELPRVLRELAASAPAFDKVAVTMTGELCDCFETKRDGVQTILGAVQTAFAKPLRIWRNDGRFVDMPTARLSPYEVASANWLALAAFVARFAGGGPGLLIDIGSTTTDIIPILSGKPVPQGRTDADRLQSGELVYRGIRRTPIFRTIRVGLAAEHFATMLDAFVMMGKIAGDPNDRETADGRPATKHFCHGRLARMLGYDGETCEKVATKRLARRAITTFYREIGNGIVKVAERLPAPFNTVVVAGSGEFAGLRIAKRHKSFVTASVVSLSERLGPGVSSAACAYAIAVLAGEDNDAQ